MKVNIPKPTAIVSVDIETTGRNPLVHSIMSIGLYVCDLYGTRINTIEVFNKDLVWDDNKPGSVYEFWHLAENAKALEFNLAGCAKGMTKQEMSDEITLFLKGIKQDYNLVFCAAPTAYDTAWIINWFDGLCPFPRKAWVDIYSFYAAIRFFVTGKLKSDHKEYGDVRKMMYAKWEGLNYKGEKHCALYDAYMQSCIMVELCEQFDHIGSLINAMKSHFE